jgi:pimeloyl-ACP methyl ester carboxylesterase
MVADLQALVAALGLETFHLVGHSMGGIVALLYAAREPSRVRRLVLIDIGPESLTESSTHSFLEGLEEMSQSVFKDQEEAVSLWLVEDPLARADEIRSWATHALQRRPDGRWEWRFDTRGIGDFLTKAPGSDVLWAAVDRVAAPTLILHGGDSWALPASVAQSMVQRFEDAVCIQIDDAGHDLGVQRPDDVATQVQLFLAAG